MARSPAKRFFGSLLFLLAAVAVLGFLFLLYAGSINDDSVPLSDKTKAVGLVVTIALAAIAFLLLLMVLTRRWSRQDEAAAQAEVFFLPEAETFTPINAASTEFVSSGDIT